MEKNETNNNNNNYQNNRKRIKRTLALTLFSIFLSLAFIGVAVYAALAQSVSITNSITITTDGQAQTAVAIYEASPTTVAGAGAFDTTTAASGLNYSDTATISKSPTENEKTGTLEQIVFGENVGKNYYAYKIVLTNTASSAVDYTINLYEAGTTNTFTPDEQIVISSSTGDGALATYAPISSSLAQSASETVYLVFSTTGALGDLTPVSETNFDLKINISVQ